MGQQQILLIVLGVIIVSLAVVVGIYVFGAAHDESIKDELVTQCMAIGMNAQQFFLKPIGMGGGENTFVSGGPGNAGYVIPVRMRTTSNGSYIESSKTDTTFTIIATPNTIPGKTYSFSNVTAVVTPTTIRTTIN